MKPALRFLIAIFLTVALTALFYLLIYLFETRIGSPYSQPQLPAFALALAAVLAPPILVACLSSKFSKRKRLLAALKAVVVVVILLVGWNLHLRPYLGAEYFRFIDDGFPYAFTIDAVIGNLLVFASALLTAIWLPANNRKPAAPRPLSLKIFEYLMALYVAGSITSAILNYNLAMDAIIALQAESPLMSQWSGIFYMGTNVATALAITVFLTLSISRAANDKFRFVLFAFFFVGLVTNVTAVYVMAHFQMALAIMIAGLIAVHITALFFVFSRRSNEWFKSRDVLGDAFA